MTDFVFATCLPGSKAWLQRELARTRPDLRPAWSRPGVMTFRSDAELADPEPRAVFARAHGRSLGFAKSTAEIVELARPIDAPLRVHVFARDPVDPDRTPIDDAPVDAMRDELLALLGDRALHDPRPQLGDRVLDVVIAAGEPSLIGWHAHDHDRSAAPGGGRRIAAPDDTPSRAFAKLEEALVWSGLPLADGDVVVEIGAAPGGAA
ncbi:MAG TPA: hypothetical protein VG755_33125, partial [Nannocystaceae bacterium]|nr:hypothetical protein [Nannocystaceae bacterium]